MACVQAWFPTPNSQSGAHENPLDEAEFEELEKLRGSYEAQGGRRASKSPGVLLYTLSVCIARCEYVCIGGHRHLNIHSCKYDC